MISKIFFVLVLFGVVVYTQNDDVVGCEAVTCAEGYRCENGVCLK